MNMNKRKELYNIMKQYRNYMRQFNNLHPIVSDKRLYNKINDKDYVLSNFFIVIPKKKIDIFIEFLRAILTMECEIHHLKLSTFQKGTGFYAHVRVILV